MRKECPTCLGLGLIPVLTPPMPCPDCHGFGYVEIEDEPEPIVCLKAKTLV
jgi:DnaJ-class molecular chaperone